MASRVRRRKSKVHRLAMLSPWQRWCIQHGDREARTAFATPAHWDETYAAVKDALMADIEDPAVSVSAFWKYDPAVPDELRTDLPLFGYSLAPKPLASEIKAEYEQLIEARRKWRKRHGDR